jgi:GntR family transcriptional regulator
MSSTFFEINASSGLPVYEQVARQITFAVAAGSLQPGEMIPSVREMARELAINPNTVARAYRQLQDAGVLESIRGSGLTIQTGATSKCKSMRSRLIRERISNVLTEARQSQLTDDEIMEFVQVEMDRKHSKREKNERA